MSRIEKLRAIRDLKNVDAFLVTSTASVKYFTGYFYNFETGPSPFHLVPAALIVANEACVVIADNESQHLPDVSAAFTKSTYESYVYEKPLEFTRQFLTQLRKDFTSAKIQGVLKERVQVEIRLQFLLSILLT